jgi:predicted  nucleic acid-binding Zn-ribbon protein
LIVRFDNLTVTHANVEIAKSSLDSHIIGLSAELDSIKRKMADMISLLGMRDAEISILNQGKCDQAPEITQLKDSNAQLTSELRINSETVRAANDTISTLRAQLNNIQETVRVAHAPFSPEHD